MKFISEWKNLFAFNAKDFYFDKFDKDLVFLLWIYEDFFIIQFVSLIVVFSEVHEYILILLFLWIFLVVFVFLRIFLLQILLLHLRIINLAFVFVVSSIEFIRSRWKCRFRDSIRTYLRKRMWIISEWSISDWIRSRLIFIDVEELFCIEKWFLSSVNIILIRSFRTWKERKRSWRSLVWIVQIIREKV
jgi:hypothetical protein